MPHKKILSENPALNGFAQHGVLFTGDTPQSKQATGTCALCGKASKFYVNTETLLWDCKKCGESGSFTQFLDRIRIENAAALDAAKSKLIAKDRGLKSQTIRAWGVGWRENTFTIPAFTLNSTGAFSTCDLRRWEIGGQLRSTKGGKGGLTVPKKWLGAGTVWICEGEWDGMAWYEILRSNKIKDDVCAIPGASSFQKKLASLFSGRDVVLLFDSDEAGQKGLVRTWNLLDGHTRSLRRLEWPMGLPDGFDIRDLYQAEKRHAPKTYKIVSGALKNSLSDLAAATGSASQANSVSITDALEQPTGKGMRPPDVEKAYKKHLIMDDCDILSVLFGSVFANRVNADPLWLFFVAPSGGSKSEFLMSLADAPLIHCITSLTPKALISGANFAGGDPSLIPKIIGKTLVVKDFTAILSMNVTAKDEIFAILRDAYDGRVTKTFGNNVTRNYEGQFGLIGGVTCAIDDARLQQLAVLGERFIRYRIEPTNEDAKIMRALDNITHEGKLRNDLKAIAEKVLNLEVTADTVPKIPRWFKTRLMKLAKWTAQLRACVVREKYTNHIMFKPSPEVGTRLAKQLATLGLGIGIYLGIDELNEKIYKLIVKVAMDTAPGRIEEVIKQLYLLGQGDWVATSEISESSWISGETLRAVLQDLTVLQIVEHDLDGGRPRYRLSSKVSKLMNELGMYDGNEKG